MRILAALFAAVVGLITLAPAVSAQSIERPRLPVEIIATEQPSPGLIEIAVTVPGVGAGELPVVNVAGDTAPSNISIKSLDSAPTVMIAIDVSGSMQGALLQAAQQAASRCMAAMSPDTAVGLIAFADTVIVSLSPRLDREPLNFALANLQAAGETATFDAVLEAMAISPVSAAETLDDRTSRFIVLVGDGEDTASTATAPEVLDRLAETGFQVYALGLDPQAESISTLEELATGSGGVVLNGNAQELGDLCASVVARIDSRYQVTLEFDEEPPSPLLFSLEFAGVIAQGAVVVPESPVVVPTTDPTATPSTPTGEDGTSGGPGEPNPSDAVSPATDAAPDGAEPGSDLETEDEPSDDDDGGAAAASGDSDNSVGGPSAVRLWAGAAAVALGPLLAAFFLAPTRRIRHGLRIRGIPRATIVARLSMQTDQLLERNRLNRVIDKKLELAALSLRAGEFVLFTALAAVGPALFLAILGMKLSGLAALIGVPLGVWMWISRRSRRRVEHFQEQLGDTLIILAGSLRSGSSTMQALAAVAAKAQSPSAEEFGRVVSEARIGRDVIESLHDLADRMGSDDVRWMVEAIALNRELGGNLAATLDNVAETMKVRAQIKSQVAVLSAEGKLTAIILLGLPFAVAGFLSITNPGYLQPLFDSGIGNMVLGIALGLMAVGSFWVSRMIKLEY